ncbi:MAG: DUF2062 domain-containing protein [Thermodesulfobacteriota bacterium]|nr:DUF2062 domain-containing protein [Thermodesulfobacteriota bacterium]
MTLKRLGTYYRLRFLRIKGDPKSIAWGSFIGALIGTMPVMPFHTIGIIAVCCSTRTSTISGLLTSLIISNPLTYIPIYYLCMVIGNYLTPYTITWSKISAVLGAIISGNGFRESVEMLSHLGTEIFIVMLTGGIIIALPTAVICYVFTLKLFVKIRQKRRERHILRTKKKDK